MPTGAPLVALDQTFRLGAELFHRSGIQAAGDGLLATWRKLQPDDLGIGERRRKIRPLEKQFRLGMDRLEGLL
jgi:hypothetical protein